MLIKDKTELKERIAILKNEVEHTFGRRIASYGDCSDLSNDIFKKTGQTLNVNTLRRFFGLVIYHHLPSGTTLNIFAQYCGFSSFDKVPKSTLAVQENIIDNHEILNFLTSLFEVDSIAMQDLAYLSVIKKAMSFLNQNAPLKKQFHSYIAKNRNGRAAYFELFVNIDSLNASFGDGLRIYLNERKSVEETVFGNALLVFKYWLVMDDSGLERHNRFLSGFALNRKGCPSMTARFYAAQLYYCSVKNLPTESIILEARFSYGQLRSVATGASYLNSFELIFAQALAFTGQFQESLLYLDAAKETYDLNNMPSDTAFFQSILLCETLVLFNLKQVEKARNLLKRLKPESFCFLSRKIETIIYLQVKSVVYNSFFQYQQQIETLIEETGFVRLNNLIYDNFLIEQK